MSHFASLCARCLHVGALSTPSVRQLEVRSIDKLRRVKRQRAKAHFTVGERGSIDAGLFAD